MAVDYRFGTKPADFARNDLTNGTNLDPGPFIGKIKNNVDPAKLGRLQVYIPELASGDENEPQNWRTVTYSSPYFGMTNQAVLGQDLNEYGATKESYGMWMTPPDIGVLVICIFINGDPNRGYYIGCIPDGTSHYMVPGLAGNKQAKVETLTQEQLIQANGAEYLPVVEFNDNIQSDALAADPVNVQHPVHAVQLENLSRQGLVNDKVRGVISSSSQRESPSAVYGFSTPGRKIAGSQDNPAEVWLRKGGHSFVMDDGDADDKDNLVRIRTSAGHQIMMNDSAGIIYIINATGKNWIEMGADGSIRAYTEADFSVHSGGAINFKSDTAFNVEAPVINLTSGTDTNIQAGLNFNLSAGNNITQTAQVGMNIGANNFKIAGTTTTMSMSGQLSLVGDKILLNSGPSTTVSTPSVNRPIGIVPDAEPWKRPKGTTSEVEIDTTLGGATYEQVVSIQPNDSDSTYDEVKTLAGRPTVRYTPFGDVLSTQPTAPGPIGPMSPEQVKTLFASIAKTESGGSYTAVNSLGYSGKYQFGVAALEDMGYVKAGTWATYKRNSVLSNPNVWSGKDGINSQEDWLASKGVQEAAMYAYSLRNYKTMVKISAVRNGDDAATVAGLVKCAHLLGPGGAKKWRNGLGGADAYGTTGEQYFAQGKAAVDSMTA